MGSGTRSSFSCFSVQAKLEKCSNVPRSISRQSAKCKYLPQANPRLLSAMRVYLYTHDQFAYEFRRNEISHVPNRNSSKGRLPPRGHLFSARRKKKHLHNLFNRTAPLSSV